MNSSRRGTLYLIDTSIYIFRAWFALPDSITGPDGEPVNAIRGYTDFLLKFLEEAKPVHVAAAFDGSQTESFRKQIYPDYKANREPAPPELKTQLAACKEITQALGIYTATSNTHEADDLIGTLARRFGSNKKQVCILSRDKDLGQLLLNTGDVLWDFAANVCMDSKAIQQKLGVKPELIPDYLGLAGDAVDNIPGVPGVGAKTAAALLAEFGALENVYECLDDILEMNLRGAKRVHALLKAHRQQAMLSRELATIAIDAPVDARLNTLNWQGIQTKPIERLYDQYGFGVVTRQRTARLKQAQDHNLQ